MTACAMSCDSRGISTQPSEQFHGERREAGNVEARGLVAQLARLTRQ